MPGTILRPGDTFAENHKQSPTLDPVVRARPASGVGSRDQVLLTGFAKADAKGSIARVETNINMCEVTCNRTGGFTGTDLKVGGVGPDAAALRPLQIEAGQIVQVTVRISFSSGS